MADSQFLELPAITANELPVTPINSVHAPVQDTPVVHKTATQEHAMDPRVSDEAYKIIGGETMGHYLVGIKPEDFLDEFLPLNADTPDQYKDQVPSQERRISLLTVPPQEGQNETHMYAPFVKALDGWVTGTDNGEKLRFARCSKPDVSCASMNPDVSTYWKSEYPTFKTNKGVEVVGPCKFSHQQTHEEFKFDHNHDAFVHESDEGPRATPDGPDEADKTSKGIHLKTEVQDEGLPSLVAKVEADTKRGIHTRGQIAAYAGVAMSVAFRTHFFSMLILGKYARMIRWDRRGAIVTGRFDYTKRPELIFDFYLRYGQLSLRQRGFDTRAVPLKAGEGLPDHVAQQFDNYYRKSWHDGAKYGHKDNDALQIPAKDMRFFRLAVEDRTLGRTETFFIPAPIFRHAYLTPFSRASRRSLAFLDHPNEGKMCFLKDSWQEVSERTAPESEIYRMLHAAKVEHMASMRLGGDVAGLETVTQNLFHRLSHSGRYRKFGHMVCHRIILDTVARDLSTFTWCKVLLSCLADVVDAAQQAYKAGILHRDLSAGNIMIVKDKNTKQWRGVLIDWDMCLLLKQRTDLREIRTARTGTWAFISAKLLMPASGSSPIIHSLEDDIESIFWVLVYEVLLYTKHDLNPYDLYKMMKELFTDSTTYKGVTTGGRQKKTAIGQCALGQSDTSIADFDVPALNSILEGLGLHFYARYAKARPTKKHKIDLSGRIGKVIIPVQPVSADFNNPDDPWLSTYLRQTADQMGPFGVTRFGLESPTMDSQPPADSDKWTRAKVNQYPADYYLMPWSKDENDSTRVKEREMAVVTSSMINHMSGLSSKRRHGDQDDSDAEPSGSAKKHRYFS